MSEILRVVDLTRRFGGVTAVDGVSLTVKEKQLRSIIGSNGAGKTTLFNVLTGRLAATGGQVFFDGMNITNWPPHRIAQLGVSRTFQRSSFFPGLTVFENIRVSIQAKTNASMRILSSIASLPEVIERAHELLQDLGLEDKAQSIARTLSHGDQRLLEVGMAISGNPKILLLDEPTAGMSPKETEHTARVVRGLAGKIAVVLVEHDMDVVMSISDHVTVMHRGRVIAEGEPSSIQQNAEVREAYLGNPV